MIERCRLQSPATRVAGEIPAQIGVHLRREGELARRIVLLLGKPPLVAVVEPQRHSALQRVGLPAQCGVGLVEPAFDALPRCFVGTLAQIEADIGEPQPFDVQRQRRLAQHLVEGLQRQRCGGLFAVGCGLQIGIDRHVPQIEPFDVELAVQQRRNGVAYDQLADGEVELAGGFVAPLQFQIAQRQAAQRVEPKLAGLFERDPEGLQPRRQFGRDVDVEAGGAEQNMGHRQQQRQKQQRRADGQQRPGQQPLTTGLLPR